MMRRRLAVGLALTVPLLGAFHTPAHADICLACEAAPQISAAPRPHPHWATVRSTVKTHLRNTRHLR
jgi:hypothetical protein